MKNKEKIFIGVAWPYVNGDLHVGHLAGYLLPADIFARFNRFKGRDVLMASGSDCFGTPITIEAEKRNLSPEEIVNEYHPKHLDLFEKAGISFDIFTKTNTKNHIKISQEFFLKFLEKGYIFKDVSKQHYDEKEKRFLPDRYVEGKCPHCNFEEARSDQCDNCGRVLDQGELKNPVSKLSGNKVILKESEHYFFDLEKLQPFIEEYFKDKSGEWKEWVMKETKNWLKRGLNSRSFSRDLEWGVPFPIDKIPANKKIENIENKRFYVWWEAVIGYLSASIEWSETKNNNWEDFWKNKDAKHFYFMGKDNLPYHTMFWPAELHLYNEKLNLPDVHVINQYLNFEGNKFSKSRGVTIDSKEIIEKYGLDSVRFYINSIMPENSDSNFNWDDFIDKHNNVLIGNLGNFINRTLTLAKDVSFDKNYIEEEVKNKINNLTKEAEKNLENNQFRNYLDSILSLSDFGNKYLTKKEPWKKEKEDKEKIITNALLVVLALQVIIKPLLIETYKKLVNLTGLDFDNWSDDVFSEVLNFLEKVKIKKPSPLFEKIDKGSN
ncbi:MAG: methionine--tRNA ligase [Candidatus Paceibacterota bacterium]